ncbi:MAG: hypothetical protein KC766_23630 [Myxococcales bacterium]|nr:hypothetical protein [Myxococcales bacterium]
MKLPLIACCAASLLIVACGGATPAPEAPSTDAAGAAEETAPETPTEDEAPADTAEPTAEVTMQVGDFYVQRFTGSFTKQPMTLTERVVAREKHAFVIDFRLEQGKHASTLRLRVDAKDPRRILQVSELDGEKESPATLAAYEALMARTMFAPDENEEQLGSEKTTCMLGDESVKCERTEYRVRIGEKSATLSVTTSKSAHGRDLGGQVMTEDGKLVYRAQLIEMGHDDASSGVASR